MFKNPFRMRDHGGLMDEDGRKSFEVMKKEIEAKGGQLHFTLKVDDEGWFSKCVEFPNIVTGGYNPNPSQEEILRSTVEAIKTAFHVPIGDLSEDKAKPDLGKVKVSWERDFCFA